MTGKTFTANPLWRYEQVRHYLRTPEKDRQPFKQFLKTAHMKPASFYRLQGKIEAEKELEDEKLKVAQQVQAVLGEAVTAVDSNKETLDLVRQIKEMDEAVFNAGKIKQVARMAELWYKRKGLIVEKQEHKVEIGLTADELARRDREAEKQLRDAGL